MNRNGGKRMANNLVKSTTLNGKAHSEHLPSPAPVDMICLNDVVQLISLKQIQEWLGHSDFSTTANIYAHLDAASKREPAETMASILCTAHTPNHAQIES